MTFRSHPVARVEPRPSDAAPEMEASLIQTLGAVARAFCRDAGVDSVEAKVTIGRALPRKEEGFRQPGDASAESPAARFPAVAPGKESVLVATPEVLGQIEMAAAIAQYLPSLRERCGVRAPVINLAGSPGVGKNTAAREIARRAGKPLIEIVAADLESPFVGGGAEKIEAVFGAAEEQSALMFIDECEPIFSRRCAASQGAEHAANALKTKLLAKLNGHPNLVICASNRMEDYDPAFTQGGRILMTITLAPPDERCREQLWKMLLRNSPIAPDVDFAELARTGGAMVGRDIDGAVWIANTSALVAGRKLVDRADLLAAIGILGNTQHPPLGTAIVDRHFAGGKTQTNHFS